ncbi:MAG: glycosyltransferase [Lachnospiraceae bacterium]|nr:glycosyltransferase [Lachnospiraceae bacterium]
MKISVITPFFDGNAYLGKYLEMMLANEKKLSESNASCGTDYAMEVILVNDSPGVGVGIPALYRQKDNWHVIENERNMGIHASRVKGLQKATGEYVMFLDQDDYITDEAMLTFLQTAVAEGSDVIVSNAYFETPSVTNLLYRTDYQKERVGDLSTYLCVGTQIVSPGQCALRVDAIPAEWTQNTISQNGADDYFLWLLLLGRQRTFFYVDLPLYTHHYTGENLSGSTEQTDASVLEFLEPLRRSKALDKGEVDLLERMIRYKATFRKSGLFGKIFSSFVNMDLFFDNLLFKKRTKTPYGFNRS